MKRVFLSLLLCLISVYFIFAKDSRTSVAVVTDKVTYATIKSDIDAFVASIDNDGKQGILLIDSWGHPDSIRVALHNLYNTGNLEGAILVGDIPIPMIRDAQHLTTAFKMSQKRDWKESSVPSDRFYDDFDLKFNYIKQDADIKLFHYYSLDANSTQHIQCDIYSSRIKPPMVPGIDKYQAIAQYLRKAVTIKQTKKQMSDILYFAGHGYNSESYNARIDEAWALREQFTFLGTQRGADLNFINFDFDKFVRDRLKSAVADPETDLSILHHHGSTDAQLLGAIPASSVTSDWIEYSKIFFRGKIRKAKDTTASKKYYMQQYDVPESWLNDAFAKEASDSTFYASMDINIPDMYGYTSNSRVVILDACFNGAFCENDYIAGYYIFNPGNTMVVKANSVNTLQDTWTNELMGLMNAGVCVGNWARGELTLESHLFGDASYSFKNAYPKYDIDNAIVTKKADNKYWKKLLDCGIIDIQALALKTLSENNAISSDEILKIEDGNPSAVMRLEAFMSLKRRADNRLTQAILLGMDDSYELLQRLATLTAAKSSDPALAEAVNKIVSDPTTSARVNFQGKVAKDIMEPTKAKLQEFKDLTSEKVVEKEKKFTVSAQRNNCSPFCIDEMLQLLKESDNQAFRIDIAETLGWYVYSYRRADVITGCEKILAVEQDKAVANELTKTINRLKNK
ncbi:MAG: hypothetical protein PHD11_01535 [Bacteroidales bacterium]|nr:hypothetical protein [Bacteroidales bacterium]MDD4670037.1 hypothetical protein [Bacteroidales bacterium]